MIHHWQSARSTCGDASLLFSGHAMRLWELDVNRTYKVTHDNKHDDNHYTLEEEVWTTIRQK